MSRKWKLVIAAVIIAIVITGLGVSIINEQSKPEAKTTVYQFKKDLDPDTIIEGNHLSSVSFPESLVNRNYVVDKESVVGKILVEKVKRDEYLMKDQFADRGLTTELINLSEYWKFSISTSELENFIGLQLERGEKYQLVFRESVEINHIRKSGWISEVIVVDLIDSIGNKVFELRDENIESIVLAIKSEGAMKGIVEKKDDVKFELIKAPDDYTGPMNFGTDEITDVNEAVISDDN